MRELEKLEKRMRDEGFRIVGFTAGPKLLDLPIENRAEVIAKEINKIHDQLKDPVNNLIARVRGKIFGLEDRIACTKDEFEQANCRQTISLFNECIDMIKTGRLP